MRYWIFYISFFVNILFSQSFFSRIIVPLYFESEFSYGYDNNYLKLSDLEENSNSLYDILGDSEQINSSIFKNRMNILYIPYIFNNHETQINLNISNSKYLSSDIKTYSRLHLKVAQHIAAYTWFKFTYSYTPDFYIKSYAQSDPYILSELRSNYMTSFFSSEKVGIELSMPLVSNFRIYTSLRYLQELQYYNSEFTEFDLEIKNIYLKIRKKLFKHSSLSIAHQVSFADNISYMNDDLLSTSDKDRSYNQNKTSISFSIKKILFLGKYNSVGISSSIENRKFLSNIENDILHFNRTHIDINSSIWLKRYLNESMVIKLKGIYRNRNTFSNNNYVENLKSFEKFEIWTSLILKMDLNVY